MEKTEEKERKIEMRKRYMIQNLLNVYLLIIYIQFKLLKHFILNDINIDQKLIEWSFKWVPGLYPSSEVDRKLIWLNKFWMRFCL